MIRNFFRVFSRADWVMLICVLPISTFGLITLYGFGESGSLFSRQLTWLIISLVVFFVASAGSYKFLRRTGFVAVLFLIAVGLLSILSFVGKVFSGAQSWLDFGLFSFQPVEFAKLVLIIVLAKYFSRRHVEIARFRHILVSGAYAFIIFALVMLQPDFGSGIIIFAIWLGMVMVSGISKKHILIVGGTVIIALSCLWLFVFADYQKARIMTFVHPLSDIHGSGYNAYQSMITVGSGEILGKGVGLGTQSRLQFLPEYETDFMFAAFAEEWGFVGVSILFILFGILLARIIHHARRGETNFEILFAVGLSVLFMSHFIIHVGMNMGVMPVTGLPMPFMSYGGTNLLISFLGIGMLSAMSRYARSHKELINREITLT